VTDTEIISELQTYIETLEESPEEITEEVPDEGGDFEGDGMGGNFGGPDGTLGLDTEMDDMEDDENGPTESGDDVLPNGDDLGIDLTDSDTE
jgi:hypothetical protein